MRGGKTRRELLSDATRLSAAGFAATLPRPLASALAAAPRPRSSLSLPSPPLKDADYWAFADWCQAGLEPLWSAARGAYSYDARVDAVLLITHSLAALEDHSGATRQDERARLLTERLLQSPPYLPGGPVSTYGPEQRHTPGFVIGITDPSSDQHVAVDPESKFELGKEPLPLSGISRFEIRCGEAQSGYSLHLKGAPAGANVYTTQPPAQSTNARPGMQLVVELAHGISWRELGLSAELIPGVR